MRRWWRRNRVSEDIATEADNGNIALAVPWWERLITVILWITVGTFLIGTLLSVLFAASVPSWVGVQAVEVTDPNVRHYTPQRTLWDWFGLIAIPLAIVLVGYILNRSDRAHERRLQDQRIKESHDIEEKRLAESQRIEQDRTQDIVVKDYLDQMTELLLTRGLRTSFEGDEVRSVARARTLTALRAVDGERKATIVQFLYEAQLIGHFNGREVVAAVVHLHKADLRGTNLGMFNLSGVNLAGATLFGARLGGAHLGGAHLAGANLTMAKLPGAKLPGANLSEANLMGADLGGANLSEANLSEAMLGGAMLDQTDLERANGLTTGQLRQAKALHGARLPDDIDSADLGDKWSPPKGEQHQS